MRVIFLDIDGVLNSENFRWRVIKEENYDPFDIDELDKKAVCRLKKIVRETNAKIILSSSWRWDKNSYEEVKQQLGAQGLEIFDSTILDVCYTMSRTAEIQLYLDTHPEIKEYVILDDDIILEPLSNNWVKCLFAEGLTAEKAAEAIEILNRS